MTYAKDRPPTPTTSVPLILVDYSKRFPVRAALVFSSILLAGLVEGVGLATLLPLMETLLNQQQSGFAFDLVKDVFAFVGMTPNLPVLLLIVSLAILLKAAFLLTSNIIIGFSIAQIGLDLRTALLKALMKARITYFRDHPIGSFGNAFGLEAHTASTVYISAFRLLAALLQLVVYLSLAAVASWEVTALAIVCAALIVVVLGRLISLAKRAGRRRRVALEKLIALLMDTLQGIKPLKASAAENRVLPLIEREAKNLNAAMRLDVVSTESMRAAQEPLATVLLAAAIGVGVFFMGIPLPSMLLTGFLFFRATSRLAELQRDYQKIRANQDFLVAYAEKVANATAARETDIGSPAPESFERIGVNNVSFSYADKPAVTDITISIERGLLTTIYGPSGAGKTTLLDLITSFHDPQTGAIMVDSVPLSEISKTSWRRGIGYLPQETFLFHDTIATNIALGDPEIGTDRIREALEAAGAWEFIKDLPDQMETTVGERGSRLSGGQRQRIALARALVRKPLLLILDEPTSALDPQSERSICNTLTTLKQQTTILAISHQDAIRQAADVVYLIEKGHLLGEERRDTAQPSAAAPAAL